MIVEVEIEAEAIPVQPHLAIEVRHREDDGHQAFDVALHLPRMPLRAVARLVVPSRRRAERVLRTFGPAAAEVFAIGTSRARQVSPNDGPKARTDYPESPLEGHGRCQAPQGLPRPNRGTATRVVRLRSRRGARSRRRSLQAQERSDNGAGGSDGE